MTKKQRAEWEQCLAQSVKAKRALEVVSKHYGFDANVIERKIELLRSALTGADKVYPLAELATEIHELVSLAAGAQRTHVGIETVRKRRHFRGVSEGWGLGGA